MAIRFTFEISEDLLQVISSGKDDNLEQVQDYARNILGIAIKNECTKICCDERNLEYQLSFIDTYKLAEVASREARQLQKIAIVCKEKYLDAGNMYETVAINRGLVVFVTSDFDEAINWIRSKE